MYNNSYEKLMLFKKKYPKCITWFRLKKHCEVLDKHLNPNEQINFIVAGQLNNEPWSFFLDTAVLAITNERILIAQNRLPFGYLLSSITPDLYNDLQVEVGMIWGTLTIDTIKEKIYLSNLDKKSLPEIETAITSFMQEMKKKYPKREE